MQSPRLKDQSYSNFESWCCSINSPLRGKKILHHSFGMVEISNISERGDFSVVGYDFLISKKYFLDNCLHLLSHREIISLKEQWLKYRQLIEVEAEEENQKHQKYLTELQSQEKQKKEERNRLEVQRRMFSDIADKYNFNVNELMDENGPTELSIILHKIDSNENISKEEIDWLTSKTAKIKGNASSEAYSKLLGIHYNSLYYKLGEQKPTKPENIWNLAKACKYFRLAEDPNTTIEISNVFCRTTHTGNPEAEAAVLTSRGGAFKDKNELDKAEQCAIEANFIAPDSFYPYNLLGSIYYLKHNYPKGDEYFKKAIQLGSTKDIQDNEIKLIIKKTDKDNRKKIINYLLNKDPLKYKWLTNL
ncbi:MAG: hypothetical protein WCF94_04310 [bacterium]